jgi:hypothetical protein
LAEKYAVELVAGPDRGRILFFRGVLPKQRPRQVSLCVRWPPPWLGLTCLGVRQRTGHRGPCPSPSLQANLRNRLAAQMQQKP